ncbi:hypothetical protein ABID21_000550 [Pseudorhizobium tarimense]|uniref:Transposase n=1 Tax=Pseudorhizobium tarimense TaxID=1079109 RepID=A0ABV2H1P1_9HYPH|nr:hypothetical protein [Pseudorhizobium tarimense]MCJ8517926.1 hypothetical protein [Pseudorhizobium tarimense]
MQQFTCLGRSVVFDQAQRLQVLRMSDISIIANTVSDLATPGMTPKELLRAVRKHHPRASKKQVTRAAFYALIISAEQGSQHAKDIHGVAIRTRNSPEPEASERI